MMACGLVVLATLSVWAGFAQAQGGATLTVELSETALEPGDTFIVSIRVSDAERTTAWQAGLAYDPDVIRATGTYTMGGFLESDHALPHSAFEDDRCVFALGQMCPKGDCVEVSGDGELVEIAFTAVADGVSPLRFVGVVFVSPESVRQQGVSWTEGAVRVGRRTGADRPTLVSPDAEQVTPSGAPGNSPVDAPICSGAVALAMGLTGGALAWRGGDD